MVRSLSLRMLVHGLGLCWAVAAKRIMCACAVAAIAAGSSARAEELGRFSGRFVFEWQQGRNMKLLEPLEFVDPKGVVWAVPAGAVTDGASIPRVFWTYAAPFEGPQRDAAVIHDHFCDIRTRPWRDTHRVFYDAMRAAGVDATTAKVLYSAVYYFGPRWGIGAGTKGPGATQNLSAEDEKKIVDNLQVWIKQSNPDVSEIETRLDGADPKSLQ